jgi:hypothetical protein
MLAQQASGYDVGGRNFHVQEKSMYKNFSFSRAGVDQSAKPTAPISLADSLSAEAQSSQLTSLVGHANSSRLVKPTHMWPTWPICLRSFQISPTELPLML